MLGMNVYLIFDGNCLEAMEFYKSVFGGEVQIMTFESSPMPVAEEYKSKILHSNLKTDNMLIMASDTAPGVPITAGNNYSLSLNFDNEIEQEEIWNKLSESANILMPLQNTFWNAKFGMLQDKFGTNWMLNYDLPQNN